MQTGLYNIKIGNSKENTPRQITKENPQQLRIGMILLRVALPVVKGNSSGEPRNYDGVGKFLPLPLVSVWQKTENDGNVLQ